MIEKILYKMLSTSPRVRAIVGDQIYPRSAPQRTKGPHIVIQKDQSDRETHLTNEACSTYAIVSVECYDKTETDAEWLFQQVRNRLSGMTLQDVTWIDHGGNVQTSQVYSVVIDGDNSQSVQWRDGSDGDRAHAHRYQCSIRVAYSQSVPTHT